MATSTSSRRRTQAGFQSVTEKAPPDVIRQFPRPGMLQVSDSALQRLVIDRLADLGREFAVRVHVETQDGEVSLRGSVLTAYEHQTILLLVKNLSPVRAVHDYLVIGNTVPGNDLAERGRFGVMKSLRSRWTGIALSVAAAAGLMLWLRDWQLTP
ncbi:BON domain-containing protein [Planctomicrobium sp. SH661]|uniref:BON domain-containing protein n=1 Tax=Planctomicrobium sp. SH661 TaxID=3448124 RepID=UPI003F5B04D5